MIFDPEAPARAPLPSQCTLTRVIATMIHSPGDPPFIVGYLTACDRKDIKLAKWICCAPSKNFLQMLLTCHPNYLPCQFDDRFVDYGLDVLELTAIFAFPAQIFVR